DNVIEEDPAGRFLAVRRGPCLELVDLVDLTVVTLPDADLRTAHFEQSYRRVVRFDSGGRRLLYLRSGGHIVVRHLATGQERELDAGPGFVLDADFDASGPSIEAEVAPSEELLGSKIHPWPRACGGAGGDMIFPYYGPHARR